MSDLWPDDFGKPDGDPPLLILKEQATAIGRRTKQKILGQVQTSQLGQDFIHSFYLLVPLLDDYMYRLFTAKHGVLLYPVVIGADDGARQYQGNNPDELRMSLVEIFSDEKTKKIISALLAQTEAALGA